VKCSLCLYVPRSTDGTADDAVTVINGQAVCYHHMGYVAGGEHSRALRLDRESRSPQAEPKNVPQCGVEIQICVDAGEHRPPCVCAPPSGHAEQFHVSGPGPKL